MISPPSTGSRISEQRRDHVGLAVPDLDVALPVREALVDAPATGRERVDTQRVDIKPVRSAPGRVELIAPIRPD